MLSFSPALKSLLAQVANKTQWGTVLNNALTETRRVRCFRDENAASTDPVAFGIEFLNIGNTGALTVQGGNIIGLGKLSGATTRTAADLATGLSVLRIEGNGHWVQGTLGLPDSGADFIMSASPTAKTGIGLKDIALRAPRLLPSGTGPIAPVQDADRPVFVEFEDWRNPAQPVLVSTIVLNIRIDDLTFDDAELAADMGDVRVTQSADSIIFEGFEFGATLMSLNPVVNGEVSKTLHQVGINCKPHGRWGSWPAHKDFNRPKLSTVSFVGAGNGTLKVDDYHWSAQQETVTVTALSATQFSVVGSRTGAMPNGTFGVDYEYTGPECPYTFITKIGTVDFQPGDQFTFNMGGTVSDTLPFDITQPPPFKIKLKRLDGTLLHTFQMQDGLPINSPELSQTREAEKPLRPLWNCAMMLFWESHKPKLNSKRYKWFAGITADSFRPTASRQMWSFNGAVPMLAGRTQINSTNHYFYAPRWPIGWSTSSPANNALDVNLGDVYLPAVPPKDYFTASTGPARAIYRAVGWDYEPGSISLHDWFTGPGGPRHDRAVIPTPLALYMSYPEGIRTRDGSTYYDNAIAFCKAYFNHSHHYFLDAKSFEMFDNRDICYGGWAYGSSYYGSGEYVPGGAERHILQMSIPNGGSKPIVRDRNGNTYFGGWGLDHLHSYCQPAWAVLLFNSPMYLVTAKLRFAAHMMAQLAQASTKKTGGFLERNGAWRWMHWCMMWKLGTSHPYGIPRSMIEDRWRIDMEVIHAEFVVPATDPTHPKYNSLDNRGLRNLGINTSGGFNYTDDGTQQYVNISSNALTFYISHVFVLMKQTGAWDAMLNKNAKCRATMEFMIQCLDKLAIEMIVTTKGTLEGGYPRLSLPVTRGLAEDHPDQIAAFPTSWEHWEQLYPPVGLEDWVHNEDGTFRSERDVGQHNRAMWAFMRRDYFPEYPHPMMDAAIAQYELYYNQKAGRVAERETIGDKINSDWTYRIPSFGRLKPPPLDV